MYILVVSLITALYIKSVQNCPSLRTQHSGDTFWSTMNLLFQPNGHHEGEHTTFTVEVTELLC